MKPTLLKMIAVAAASATALLTALNLQATTTSVTVWAGGPDAPNPGSLWTDTGITVSTADLLGVSASGQWSWGGGILTDAGGTSDYPPDGDSADEFVPDGRHGQLIGFVGDPGENPINLQPDPYFSIGNASRIQAPLSGELWLGFNDDKTTDATVDNQGFVNVTLTVSYSSPDGGATVAFLASSMALLALMRWGHWQDGNDRPERTTQ